MKQETNSTLLIRIDERQQQMSKDIVEIKNDLCLSVKEDNDYKDMVKKVATLWDDRNKVVGWLIGSGVIGGTLPLTINNLWQK